MANRLNQELEGKVVVFLEEVMTPEYKSLNNRLFKVSGGFGASSFTAGTALFGEFLIDGEKARMAGYYVERLATEEEIENVRIFKEQNDEENKI